MASTDGQNSDSIGPIRMLTSQISINAPVRKVWETVSDLDRMPDLHPQILEAHWVEGSTHPEIGARFRTRNALSEGLYEAVSEIVELKPDLAIAWTIEGTDIPPMVCRFDLVSDPTSASEQTELHQTYFYDVRPGAAPPISAALGYRLRKVDS